MIPVVIVTDPLLLHFSFNLVKNPSSFIGMMMLFEASRDVISLVFRPRKKPPVHVQLFIE